MRNWKWIVSLILTVALCGVAASSLAFTESDLPAPVPLGLHAKAPSFSMTALGGEKLTSEKYATSSLILVYGRTTCGNTQEFLRQLTPAIPLLKEEKVTVLVGLFSEPDDRTMRQFAEKYPGIVCGRITEVRYLNDDTSGMWQGLEAVGEPLQSVTFPVVFLRSSAGELRYYSIGDPDQAQAVAAGAILMARGRTKPTATPKPTKTPRPTEEPTVTPGPEDPTAEPTAAPTPEFVPTEVEGGGLKYRLSSGKAIVTGPSKKTAKTLSIPDQVNVGGWIYPVTEIRASAFKNMKKLTSVTIGKNVKTIGKNAFSGCSKLKKITLKTTALKKVGSAAFKGIAKSAVFTCPAKKLTSYKKLLKKGNPPSGVKYKK